MRGVVASLAVAVTLAVPILSEADHGHHVKVDLVAADGSGVSGFVQITKLPQGGSNVTVHVKGLRPRSPYAAFHGGSSECDQSTELLQGFTADARGNGRAAGKIARNIDEVGSIAVRDGDRLLACAVIHPER